MALDHTGAGRDGDRTGVLWLGPVVRHPRRVADRLKVREAMSIWDSGTRPVRPAACRVQHARSAVPRARGCRGTKLAGADSRTRNASILSAARRCPRASSFRTGRCSRGVDPVLD
jgi:hypothetical protein